MAIRTCTLIACFAGALTLSSAATAVPNYTFFGPLPGATFGGTGIPNDEVAVSEIIYNGDATLTIAMSATQRYNNPALTNDGLGTYFAGAGSNTPPGASGPGALWNFNFYVDIAGGSAANDELSDYEITLFYDFDPALDVLGTGELNLSLAPGSHLENSQNLSFGYLALPLPGVTPPTGVTSFDADALGEYNFGIEVRQNGQAIGAVAMDVQVEAVPIPAAAWLFGSALLGLGAIKRRKA